jgi:CHAT domain-containing protein
MSQTLKDGDLSGRNKIVHGDLVHGDKVAGNKITIGNVSGSGQVNIAGGDLNARQAAQPTEQAQAGPVDTPPISILFLSADPTDAARLRAGAEAREIGEKLRLSRYRDQFKLSLRTSVRPEDLSQALLDEQPQIVHFSGHGSSSGVLCFENQSGRALPVEPQALAALFEQFTDQVQCVVLNACYSELQARAIAQHIPAVIGMAQAVSDQAAIAFAVGFYQALGAGRDFAAAYKLGCVQTRLQGLPEHLTPVFVESTL